MSGRIQSTGILSAMFSAALILLPGCGDGKPEERAFLEVRVSHLLGEVGTRLTFKDGRREVSAVVLRPSITTNRGNAPVRGDYGEIYELLTGKAHPDPKSVTSVESIQDAAKAAGWEIEEDTSARDDDDEIGELTIYRMWR